MFSTKVAAALFVIFAAVGGVTFFVLKDHATATTDADLGAPAGSRRSWGRP